MGSLKDYVKGIFSFKDATNEADQQFTAHMDTVAVSDQIYGRVGEAMSSLRNKLLAFAGVYAAQDVFHKAIDEGSELEQLYTGLANRFGNERFAQDITRWITRTTGHLPIATDEMRGFVNTMDQFAINPQLANLEGVLGAALGPGKSVSNVMSQITSLAQSGDITGFVEAFAGRVSPEEIANALGDAVTVQERIIALTDLMDQEFGGNIERYQNTIKGQMGQLSNIFDLFKQALVGDPEAGTFFGEFKLFVQGFTGWFLERKDEIIGFGKELGNFFGKIFRLFRQNFFALGDFSDRAFNTIRGFIQSSRELVNPFLLFLAIAIEKVKVFFDGFIDGFTYFLDIVKAVIEGIVSGIGTMLTDVLGIDEESRLSGFQERLEAIFDNEMVRDFGNAVGFAAGMFATLWGFLKVGSAITKIGSALKVLGGILMANPYVAVITGLALAGVALYQAWDKNLFGLRDDLDPLFQWLIGAWETVRDSVVEVWGDMVSEVGGFFNSIQPELQTIWSVLKPLVDFIGGAAVRMVKMGLDILVGSFQIAFRTIKGVIVSIWDILAGFVKTVVNLLTGDLAGAWEGFKQMFGGIKDLFVTMWTGVFDAATNMFGNVLDAVGDQISAIADKWKDVFSSIFRWLGGKVNEYIIDPLNKLGSYVGIEIPKLDINESGGGTTGQGRGAVSPIELDRGSNGLDFGMVPAGSDGTNRQVTNNRNFNISVQVQPGENPESAARRVYKEMERQERRKMERGQ